MTALVPNGKQQFCDSAGVPLALGSVYFYVPGTTTLKDTWQDNGQAAKNANPVPLDAAGRAAIYGVGDYRQIVQDKNGNTIWDQVSSAPPAVADLNAATTGIATLNGQVAGLTATQTTQASLISSHTSSIATLKSTSGTGGTLYYPTYAALVAAFAAYNAATAYAKGATLVDQGIAWVNILASTGTAPPTLPATSNASWQVFRNPLIGQAFSVATTDTSAHTDPAVGGTVNNAGVFAWATGTAGTGAQYLFANDAALAKGYSDAAAASATTALAQVPLVNAAGATQIAAVNAAGSSNLASLNNILPLHDDALAAVITFSETQLATDNLDGTATLGGGQLFGTATLGRGSLASVAAGNKPCNIVCETVSGSLTGGTFTQYNDAGTQVGSTITATVGATSVSVSTVLNAACTNIRFVVTGSTGAVAKLPAYSFGPSARVVSDPTYLTAAGYGRSVVDRAEQLPCRLVGVGGLASISADGTTVTCATGGVSTFYANVPRYTFVDGDTGVIHFRANSAIIRGLLVLSTRFENGTPPGGPGTFAMSAELIGQASGFDYRAAFNVYAPAAQPQQFYGVQFFVTNTTGQPYVFSDFTQWRGLQLPATLEAPSAVKTYASARAQQAVDDIPSILQIDLYGDSETHYGESYSNPLDYKVFLKQLVGDRAVITNLGCYGDPPLVTAARQSGLTPTVTISGNQIPASGPVSITAWDIDPVRSPTYANLNIDRLWFLGNVLGRVEATGYRTSGDIQAPTTLTFTRLKSGAAVSVPAGSKMIARQGLVSRKRKQIIMIGRNGPSDQMASLAGMTSKLTPDQYIILPMLCDAGAAGPSTNTAAVLAAYPGRVVDLNGQITAGEKTAITTKYGYTFTSGDNTQIAASQFPSGLTVDGVHRVTAANDVINAQRIFASTQFQTWLS